MNIPQNPNKDEVLHRLLNVEHCYNSCDLCPRCTALELAELEWLREVILSISLRSPKVKI
jgi:hypothetical protein